jgi:hypothetical protein
MSPFPNALALFGYPESVYSYDTLQEVTAAALWWQRRTA